MLAQDSRSDGGPGVLVLQDHTPTGGRGGLQLSQRFMIMAERKIGRDAISGTKLGHLRHERGSVGDLIGGFMWKPTSRPMPAWGFVFPSQTLAGIIETVTFARGAVNPTKKPAKDGPGGKPGNKKQKAQGGTGPTAGQGVDANGNKLGLLETNIHLGALVGAGGATGPGAGGQLESSVFFEADGKGGAQPGLFGVFDERPIITHDDGGRLNPFGPDGINSKKGGDVKAWIGGYAEPIIPPVVRPSEGTGWNPDIRFRAIQPPLPKGWPQLPRRWHGLTVPATNEDRQIEYFHPTDPRIPLVHRAGEAQCGAVACDLDTQNQPDPDRHARLHTMLRILKAPVGARNVLAWNLTRTGRGDSRGGYVIDRSKGSQQKPNTGRRGPTSGTPRTQFRGANGGVAPGIQRGGANAGKVTRLVVAVVSHNDGGFFHPGLPNDIHQITTDGDGNPINPLHFDIDKGLFLNPSREHEDGPLDLTPTWRPGGDLDYPTGVNFAWNGFKKKFGWWTTNVEEYVPYEPPFDPDEPPTIDTPRKPRAPTSGTPRDQLTGVSIGGAGPGGEGIGRVQLARSRGDARVGYTRRWMEAQLSSMSFRAQIWGSGSPNMIHDRQPAARVRLDRLAPAVLRSETFGKQSMLGATFTGYTQIPGASRYEGGTIAGGEWLFPPEVGGEDYADDFAPGDRSISSAVFGVGPGVTLGFGLPDLPTGGIRSGVGFTGESANLALYGFDSAGLGTERMRFENGGGIRWPMIIEPSAPAGSHLVLYALGDRLYSKGSADVPRPLDLKTVTDSISASATQSQGEGQLESDFNVVTTTATANDTVTLPPMETGREVVVENLGAETLQIFPASGESIDAGATNASTTLVAGASVRMVSRNATNWRTV